MSWISACSLFVSLSTFFPKPRVVSWKKLSLVQDLLRQCIESFDISPVVADSTRVFDSTRLFDRTRLSTTQDFSIARDFRQDVQDLYNCLNVVLSDMILDMIQFPPVRIKGIKLSWAIRCNILEMGGVSSFSLHLLHYFNSFSHSVDSYNHLASIMHAKDYLIACTR